MSNENGGPAFPMRNRIASSRNAYSDQGVDMRDYFAARASDADVSDVMERASINLTRQQARYIHADAMLKERAK